MSADVKLTEAQAQMLRACSEWEDGVGFYLYPEDRARGKSLIKRGLLVNFHDDDLPPQFVSITDAGRAALAALNHPEVER